MSGSYRPIYENESVTFQLDRSSPWSLLATTSVTASNFQSIEGSAVWTIQIPDAVTGLQGGKVGNLVVQVNNSNPIYNASLSSIPWTTNPLMNQPGMGKRNVFAVNSGFTANWSSLGTIGGTVSISAFTCPSRYVRLFGVGLTALVGSSAAFLFSEGMSRGN